MDIVIEIEPDPVMAVPAAVPAHAISQAKTDFDVSWSVRVLNADDLPADIHSIGAVIRDTASCVIVRETHTPVDAIRAQQGTRTIPPGGTLRVRQFATFSLPTTCSGRLDLEVTVEVGHDRGGLSSISTRTPIRVAPDR